MYIANVTVYDSRTDDYNDSLSKSNNCTNKENNTSINIPSLLLTIPCGLSFLFLMS